MRRMRERIFGLPAAIGFVLAVLVAGGAAEAPAQSGRDDSLFAGGKMSCRDVETSSRRLHIAGGQAARVEDFPFIAQVRVGRALCGGSLFAPGFVLTAAHCVMPIPGSRACEPDGPGRCKLAHPSLVKVSRAGGDGRATGESAGATHVFAHPKFRYPIGADDIGALDADIAIIRLGRRMAMKPGDYVGVADPAFDASFAQGGECARVAGWGRADVLDSALRTISEGASTDKLQALNLELQPKARCVSRYPGQITDNMLCAGDGVEGFNTCKGDSGGPLVVDVGGPIQVGVVSWAYGCAQKEHYTVFTRIGAPEVRDWINETMLGDR